MTSSKRKQPAFSATDEQLRWFAFIEDDQRTNAEMVAALYKKGHVKEAARLLEDDHDWLRLLPLVLAALNGKRAKSEQNGIKIVRAWIAAMEAKGFNFDQPTHFPWVTIFEIRRAFARALGFRRPSDETEREWLNKLAESNAIPRHEVFKATLTRCKLSWREDRCRRPRKRIRS